MAEFARCVIRAAPQAATSFIDTKPASIEEGTQLDLLLQRHGKCLELPPSLLEQQVAARLRLGQITMTQAIGELANRRTQMIFSRQAFRGAIAERLYIDRISSDISDTRDAVVPAGYAVVRCAAARNPIAADRLVRSKRLSQDEAEATKSLTPALQECGRGKGQLDISGTSIHGWTAEALYRQRGAEMAERR